MFKQILMAAELQTREGWMHQSRFVYRGTNSQLARILDQLGEAVGFGTSAAGRDLVQRLGGIPAKFRRITLPQLLEYPWDHPEQKTLYVSADELETARSGQLPQMWADSPQDECALPVNFSLTPRMVTGRFTSHILDQLRSIVDNHINDYKEVRVIAALVS